MTILLYLLIGETLVLIVSKLLQVYQSYNSPEDVVLASQGVGAVPTYDFAIGRATDKDEVKQHQVKFNVHRLIITNNQSWGFTTAFC